MKSLEGTSVSCQGEAAFQVNCWARLYRTEPTQFGILCHLQWKMHMKEGKALSCAQFLMPKELSGMRTVLKTKKTGKAI